MVREKRFLRWGLAILIGMPFGFAQDSREVPFGLRTGVDLVLVRVTLVDGRGALVTDLDRHHFSVLQDNGSQHIVSFSRESEPCSLAVVLDTSGSMTHQLDVAKELTSEILSMSEPQDEAFIATVSDKPQILERLTTEADSARSLLPFVKPGGSTALVDTVYQALNELRNARNPRKALLVISDGMDNNSRHSKAELMRLAMEADAQIYTVSLGAATPNSKAIALREEQEGLRFLTDLAADTGGLHYRLGGSTDIVRVSKSIGEALRDQYVVGYTPTRDSSGKWHKIRIQLDLPKISVHARAGYYAREI